MADDKNLDRPNVPKRPASVGGEPSSGPTVNVNVNKNPAKAKAKEEDAPRVSRGTMYPNSIPKKDG